MGVTIMAAKMAQYGIRHIVWLHGRVWSNGKPHRICWPFFSKIYLNNTHLTDGECTPLCARFLFRFAIFRSIGRMLCVGTVLFCFSIVRLKPHFHYSKVSHVKFKQVHNIHTDTHTHA